MTLAHATRTTLTDDQQAAHNVMRLNMQVKTLVFHRRRAFYVLKARYLNALYHETPYVVGVFKVGTLYEFHLDVGDDLYVFHQPVDALTYRVCVGGRMVYPPHEYRKPLTANGWQSAVAAVECWLCEIGVTG